MFSDHRIRAALEAGAVGAWRWEVGCDQVQWSPNLEAIHGLAPGTFAGTFAAFADDIHPEDRDRVMAVISAALEAAAPYKVEYRLPPRENSPVRWIEARGVVEGEPGAATAMTGVCQDITDQKRLEMELASRLRQQEAVASLGTMALHGELPSLLDEAVRQVARTLDVPLAKVLELLPQGDVLLLRAGVGWTDGAVGSVTVGAGGDSQAGHTLHSRAPVIVTNLRQETRFNGPPLLHDHGVVSGLSVTISGSEGTPYGVLGVHSREQREFTLDDVNFLQSVANILGSAIQRAHTERLRDLLGRDLRHRFGNLFHQLIAIHSQTARTSGSVAELSEKFEERVAAAARTHGIISEGGWSATPVATLFKAMLEAFADRTTVSGPPATLPAEAALAMGLVLNELATNAAKYGCFSGDGGRLVLTWELPGDGSRLVIHWNEQCAHPVGPPERSSFGSKLIGSLIRHQLGGDLDLEFASDGLRARISLPIAVGGCRREPTADPA